MFLSKWPLKSALKSFKEKYVFDGVAWGKEELSWGH